MSNGATVAGLGRCFSWQAGKWLPAFTAVLLVHGAVMYWLFGPATAVNLQASQGSPVYIDMVMVAAPEAPAQPASAEPAAPAPETPPEPVPEPVVPDAEEPAELAEPAPEPDKAAQSVQADVPEQASEAAPPEAGPAPGVASGRERAEQVNWQTRLLVHLERQKRYPLVARQRNEQGIVRVRVTIDRKGRVLATSLVQSSGSQWLDREALALPTRAQPLPAPPDSLPGDPLALQIPISFTLR